MDEIAIQIEVMNKVTNVLWGRSSDEDFRILKGHGDYGVRGIISGIGDCADGSCGAAYWWDGAKQLCQLLAEIGGPFARKGLLAIVMTDSSFAEFDQVRASAATQLAGFRDDADELVPKLIEASRMPHAPVVQIQATVEALGAQTPMTPELIIAKGNGYEMSPRESIEFLGTYQDQASQWDATQRCAFFRALGLRVKAAFNNDGRLAEKMAAPYFAAALLADPDPEYLAWGYFPGLSGIERSEAGARMLVERYPLPETPPIPDAAEA